MKNWIAQLSFNRKCVTAVRHLFSLSHRRLSTDNDTQQIFVMQLFNLPVMSFPLLPCCKTVFTVDDTSSDLRKDVWLLNVPTTNRHDAKKPLNIR